MIGVVRKKLLFSEIWDEREFLSADVEELELKRDFEATSYLGSLDQREMAQRHLANREVPHVAGN